MSDPHDREPVDQATIDGWRVNYGLDTRTPADAARYWADRCAGMAPAGAVAALGIALDDMDALRKDAGRYRRLRDLAIPDVYVWDQRNEKYQECGQMMRGAELDAAIDGATET